MVTEEKPYTVGIFENKIEIINGISSAPSMDYTHVDMDAKSEGRIIDIKFLSDQVLIILCQPEGESPLSKSTRQDMEYLCLRWREESLPTSPPPLSRSTTTSRLLALPGAAAPQQDGDNTAGLHG